jgi:polysaccharide biosynthesis transport protein
MNAEPSSSDDRAFHSGNNSSEGRAAFAEPISPHRWLAALVTGLLLAATAGALVMYFYTPQYEATALLKIEDARPFVAFSSPDKNDQSERYVEMQLELLRSPLVLEPVLGRAEIAAMSELSRVVDRVKYLQDRLSAKQAGRSELYNITYKSPSAQDAANVVNAVAAEYIKIHGGDEFDRSQHVIKILEEERHRRELEVERLRKVVVDLAKEVTGRAPFGRDVTLNVDSNHSRNASLQERLLDTDLERAALKAEVLNLRQHVIPKNELYSAALDADSHLVILPEIRPSQAATEESESIVEQIKHTDAKWSDNPLYVRLDKAVQSQRAALDKLKHELSERPHVARLNRHEQNLEQSIAAIEAKLAGLDAKKQLLSQQLEEMTNKQESGKSKSVELEFVRAELAREEKIFELIAERKLALQTELRAPSRVEIRQKAMVPSEPDASRPYKQLAIVCTAALLAPFVFTIAWRRPTRNVK